MGTLNKPGKFDCMARLRQMPDAPYFLLLATDRHAPALVWLWSTLAELEGPARAEKSQEARDVVAQMLEWQHANGRKAAGFGQAVLAGVMDMIRVINSAAKEGPKNSATPLEVVRLYMANVDFGSPERLAAAAEEAERLRAVVEEYDGVVASISPAAMAEDGGEADFVMRVKDYRALREAAAREA